MAQGGGWGFVGDMVLGDTTQDRSPMDSLGRSLSARALAAPPICGELTKGNIDESIAGRTRTLGRNRYGSRADFATREPLVCKGCPRSHGIVCPVRKNLSPGYLSRIQNKARHDWNQEYFWRPNEATPAGRRALLKWLVVVMLRPDQIERLQDLSESSLTASC